MSYIQILDLIENISLVFILLVVYYLLPINKINKKPVVIIGSGVLCAALCILIIYSQDSMSHNIVMNSKSILFGLMALFFGGLPVLVASFLTLFYVWFALTNDFLVLALTIIGSSLIGLLFRELRQRYKHKLKKDIHIYMIIFCVSVQLYNGIIYYLANNFSESLNMSLVDIIVVLFIKTVAMSILCALFYQQHERYNTIVRLLEQDKELNFLNFHDPLTGIYNKQYYEKEVLRLDKEEFYPISILIIDIDELRMINNSFGFRIGDFAIDHIAKNITTVISNMGTVCRTSGDDFTVILPNSDVEKTKGIIKELNKINGNFTVEGINITVSIGYATKESSKTQFSTIERIADEIMYKNKLNKGPSILRNAIDSLISRSYVKDYYLEDHSLRVSQLCVKFGQVLELNPEEIELLGVFGELHDVGKVSIPSSVLNKVEPLNSNDWEEIKKHCEAGCRILRPLPGKNKIAEFVLCHHEKWDGTGYPNGLSKNDIPFLSRLLSIADAFDAMTSDRIYRKKLSNEFAINELRQNAGKQFDPYLVNIFCSKVV